jgi:hypothetical protein
MTLSRPATKSACAESNPESPNHDYLTHDQREWPCEAVAWTTSPDQREWPREAVARAASTRLLFRAKIRTIKENVHCRVLPSILCLSNAHASQDEDTRKDEF